MSMYPPSDKELDEFPHVTMTSADECDPDHYDYDSPTQDIPLPPVFEEGKTVDHYEQYSYDDHVDASLCVCKGEVIIYKPCGILPFKPDFTKLHPFFGWAPVSCICDTIHCTTQWYKAEGCLPMQRHYKSCFPGANIPHHEETMATDTSFSDTPAFDDGIPGHG